MPRVVRAVVPVAVHWGLTGCQLESGRSCLFDVMSCRVSSTAQHWQRGVLVAFKVLCKPVYLLPGILVEELLLHLRGFRNLTFWMGRRLKASCCFQCLLCITHLILFFSPQIYLETAVSPSVMEVFISTLNTLFTVVPNMRNKFSKKLGMGVVWDHVLCALN